ncbi:MAG: DUF1255 family protein [Syntrophaceae bacterium]|nr:DUF1255 family protein [Syntrophaceae bacterium]
MGACLKKLGSKSKNIGAIGIAYQMHGLVTVDNKKKVLRPSIIWCDSRAVEIGEKAFEKMGKDFCLHHLLNSPGNFTASKLAWVRENEPALFKRIYKIMLPGDYEFGTSDREIMEIIAGELDVMLPGNADWITVKEGDVFEVPAQSKFSLKVKFLTDYCCSYVK